ncbi:MULTISPECIES: amino acid adenylation domain-containing protein [unclassified Streptomyces]|uniref:amino acid adenylation domain-containing protein n=1 Tax=unclassified Streptomyces TaxID=2593676 RepID=UPI0022B64484|nr:MULTISPECIES: amino acid adenylation domain-containing protein [unclassified Streptomyces]MCZ7416216.1 amino acid adenylation domain-containing protein [Streptomyces sp. WMMC897]MCZ7433975.1 amino acid adenylation domain-containing protein [Streptomyces sp. WMMC1477]
MRLHELLTASARRHPRAVAVHGPEGPVSYAELDALADRYAAALTARGVRPGDRVVIWSHKGVRTVAVMQAALRTGAIYVPVTGSNPPARLARITSSAAPALVVADPEAAERARPDWAGAPLVTFGELLEAAPEGASASPHESAPDDPAYILYTSGSTGEPKGVCISHRNALAFVEWAVAELDVGPDDRLSNHAPFNFDLSVFDLYAAFAAGAAVHLVPQEMAYAPAQLAQFMREREITVWYSVPSALSLMIREGDLLDEEPPPALRACVFAGEPFAIHHVQALRTRWPKVRLLNWYGPTETNVCTSYEVTDADLERTGALPIGVACSGDEVTLDPPGAEEGEVVVAGPTVMLGYWGREPHTGPYRTGDLARRDEEGRLHYVGRRDHMVKIRGHRIELGEIESAIGSLDTVADVAVLVAGSGLEATLHAVVVPAPEGRPSLLNVKRCCAERLPTYMIIDKLHVQDDLPRTANGKLDRPLLAAKIEAGEL